MMLRIIAAILCLMMSFSSCSAYAESTEFDESLTIYDFKTFVWGDSKEKVISVEGKPVIEKDVDDTDATFFSYETHAVGMDMILTYYFCDNGLYQVRYDLNEKHSNNELYIDGYEAFKAALTKKYGAPVLDNENWSNSSIRQKYSDRKGTALFYGYLSYSTWYITDSTIIGMSMSAEDFKITMVVEYVSKEIVPNEADYSSDI